MVAFRWRNDRFLVAFHRSPTMVPACPSEGGSGLAGALFSGEGAGRLLEANSLPSPARSGVYAIRYSCAVTNHFGTKTQILARSNKTRRGMLTRDGNSRLHS